MTEAMTLDPTAALAYVSADAERMRAVALSAMREALELLNEATVAHSRGKPHVVTDRLERSTNKLTRAVQHLENR